MMIKITQGLLLLLMCAGLVVIGGCGEEPVANAPQTVAKKVRPTKPGDVVQKEKEEPAKEIFTYSPIGKRDPFESLLQKEKKARQASVPRTPLEKFDLGQFRIQAILVGKGAPRAMVSAPDGKNYILKPGLKIGKNNGVIRNITDKAVLVEESSFDLAGNLIKGIQSIRIPEKDKF